MTPRTRTFHNPTTGAVWATDTEGTYVTVTSGKPGKEKTAVKPQADALSTQRFLDKEEGARLRKGFILSQPQAGPGEPLMLRFLDRGYTGAMSLAFHEGQLLVNQHAEDRDALWLVNRHGDGGPLCALPSTQLVWKILPAPAPSTFLLLADHQVLSWNARDLTYTTLTTANRRPVSVLDGAGSAALWYEDPDVVVRDLEKNTDLFRQRVEPTLYSGHSMQMAAALSPEAALIAYSSEPGIVVIQEVATGAQRQIRGDFAMVRTLAFTPDGKRVLLKEDYGGWSLRIFDAETGEQIHGWPDLANTSFAIDPTGHRLAVSARDKARLYSLTTLELEREFAVDQCVKRFVVAWSEDGLLATRTDLGVLGLYQT